MYTRIRKVGKASKRLKKIYTKRTCEPSLPIIIITKKMTIKKIKSVDYTIFLNQQSAEDYRDHDILENNLEAGDEVIIGMDIYVHDAETGEIYSEHLEDGRFVELSK